MELTGEERRDRKRPFGEAVIEINGPRVIRYFVIVVSLGSDGVENHETCLVFEFNLV